MVQSAGDPSPSGLSGLSGISRPSSQDPVYLSLMGTKLGSAALPAHLVSPTGEPLDTLDESIWDSLHRDFSNIWGRLVAILLLASPEPSLKECTTIIDIISHIYYFC